MKPVRRAQREDETTRVTVVLDGEVLTIAAGSSVAAALAARPPGVARVSPSGEPRSAFCGMGICHECRCTIDGRRRLACQTICGDGMRIESLAPAAARGNDRE